MKYSLKNKQFRKKNTIFGQRKKQQHIVVTSPVEHSELPFDVQQDLQIIRQSMAQSSSNNTNVPEKERVNKLYQYINFGDQSPRGRRSNSKKQLKRNSIEGKHNRHCLSPASKPILDNPDIRLAESTVHIHKILELSSETVNFSYRPKRQPEQNKQLFELFKKLYTLFIKNNQRIDQLQSILSEVIFRDQLVAKQLNQGLKTAINIEEQTNLFVNTMRSVYQNLRVCRLKQQNLELYFNQKQPLTQNQALTNQDNFYNNLTVKYGQPKINLSKKQSESLLNISDKQSKQLIQLLDYESDSSFSQIVNQKYYKSIDYPQAFKKNQHKEPYKPVLPPIQLQQSFEHDLSYQQFSPFQANRMMSVQQSSVTMKQSGTFPIKESFHSQFSTFRSPNHCQKSSQEQLFKKWLDDTNQQNMKCWLDNMGCLRRGNNTYIFNDKGQVITMSHEAFERLINQGKLLPVFDQ